MLNSIECLQIRSLCSVMEKKISEQNPGAAWWLDISGSRFPCSFLFLFQLYPPSSFICYTVLPELSPRNVTGSWSSLIWNQISETTSYCAVLGWESLGWTVPTQFYQGPPQLLFRAQICCFLFYNMGKMDITTLLFYKTSTKLLFKFKIQTLLLVPDIGDVLFSSPRPQIYSSC